MRELMEKVTRGTGAVFESPGLAAALYAGALVAVVATIGLREED